MHVYQSDQYQSLQILMMSGLSLLLLHKFWSHFGIFGVEYQTFQHVVLVCIMGARSSSQAG